MGQKMTAAAIQLADLMCARIDRNILDVSRTVLAEASAPIVQGKGAFVWRR